MSIIDDNDKASKASNNYMNSSNYLESDSGEFGEDLNTGISDSDMKDASILDAGKSDAGMLDSGISGIDILYESNSNKIPLKPENNIDFNDYDDEFAEIEINTNGWANDSNNFQSSSSAEFFDKTSHGIDNAIFDLFKSLGSELQKGQKLIRQETNSDGLSPDAENLKDHPWFNPPKLSDSNNNSPNNCNEAPMCSRISQISSSQPMTRDFFEKQQRPFIESLDGILNSYSDDFATFGLSEKQVFYRQAKQFENETGQVCEEVSFSSYYPNYPKMSKEQSSWYFYWRGNLRNRIYVDTSTSYHFLYFYELINLVGFNDPKCALDQMLFVWKEARYKNKAFDSYLPLWVRDFIVYYKLDNEYYSVVEEILGELTGKFLYEECLLYLFSGVRKKGVLFALQEFSDYKIIDSNFYKNGYSLLIEDIVCNVLLLWSAKSLEKSNLNLLYSMVGVPEKHNVYTLFPSALFYRDANRILVFDSFKNSGVVFDFIGGCLCSNLLTTANSNKKVRKFFTGLLRTVESTLRDLTSYKFSLRDGLLPKTKVSLIKKQTIELYQEHLDLKKKAEKKFFLVDDSLLEKLKADSEKIRERLIAEQNYSNVESDNILQSFAIISDCANSENLAEKDSNNNGALDGNVKIFEDTENFSVSEISKQRTVPVSSANGENREPSPCIEKLRTVPVHVESCEIKENESGSGFLSSYETDSQSASNPFLGLYSALSKTQCKFLFLVYVGTIKNTNPDFARHISNLQGDFFSIENDFYINESFDALKELRFIASSSNTFLNVIIEEINDLALDLTGDCIIDTTSPVPSLYEDYLDDIGRLFVLK